MPCLIRPKQLSMAATARVMWLARPWVGVRMCHLLLLLFKHSNLFMMISENGELSLGNLKFIQVNRLLKSVIANMSRKS